MRSVISLVASDRGTHAALIHRGGRSWIRQGLLSCLAAGELSRTFVQPFLTTRRHYLRGSIFLLQYDSFFKVLMQSLVCTKRKFARLDKL